jgi:hypothetical protein
MWQYIHHTHSCNKHLHYEKAARSFPASCIPFFGCCSQRMHNTYKVHVIAPCFLAIRLSTNSQFGSSCSTMNVPLRPTAQRTATSMPFASARLLFTRLCEAWKPSLTVAQPSCHAMSELPRANRCGSRTRTVSWICCGWRNTT